jgi:voltage-gated potassium channel
VQVRTAARSPWRIWTASHRFTVLLCTLVLLMCGSPIAKALRTPTLYSRLLVLSCFSIMLLSAVFAISRSRRQLITAGILAVPTLLLQAVNVYHDNQLVRGWAYVLMVVFLGYVVRLIIRALFRHRHVTADMLCASICAYLLIGVGWAFAYSLIDMIQPGSFMISEAHGDMASAVNVTGEHAAFAVYYSFVTLSTLGFGDVIPVNPIARVSSYCEALFGQIYLAILVGRLVGLHISETMQQDKERERIPQ